MFDRYCGYALQRSYCIFTLHIHTHKYTHIRAVFFFPTLYIIKLLNKISFEEKKRVIILKYIRKHQAQLRNIHKLELADPSTQARHSHVLAVWPRANKLIYQSFTVFIYEELFKFVSVLLTYIKMHRP